jgi:hypothetical protein
MKQISLNIVVVADSDHIILRRENILFDQLWLNEFIQESRSDQSNAILPSCFYPLV